jgi:hypothetical protein
MTIPSKVMSVDGYAMAIEGRERMLGLFAVITQPDAGSSAGKSSSSPDLEEMIQVKVLQILMMFLDPN